MNSYRPEIDGLRAVAVISVLLFHLGAAQFSGGFVGVDVFFVISGYLITRLIRADVIVGTFTFGRFYIRRARRLFPALLFTLAASLAGACLLMSPVHLTNFSASLIAAILSVSNIQFWNESGYFDLQASVKPLLHTSSLAIEEQFYLIWPALLWLLLRRPAATAVAVIGAVGVLSFALNFGAFRWFSPSPPTIFYLLPFRIFEFAIGAGLVWTRPLRNAIGLEVLSLLGLALILWSVFTYTERILFPSYNALAPCIGAALVIYAGGARYVGSLLRNRAAVGIGLISYSLYLIHWPLIVFWRYYTLQPLGPTEQVAVSTVALASAILMYRYVETPFRRAAPVRRSQYGFVESAFGAAASMLTVACALFASGGWPERIPEAHLIYPMGTADCGPQLPELPLVKCAAERHSNKSIFVWGDSHARVLISGLATSYPDHDIKIFTRDGCRPQSGDALSSGSPTDDCGQYNRATLQFLLSQQPADVILHYYIQENEAADVTTAKHTVEIMDRLASVGHHVVLLGGIPRPSIYLPDCFAVPRMISDSENRCRGNEAVASALAEQNRRMKEWFGGERFVDPSPAFFAEGRYRARIGNNLFFEDSNHLAPYGSRFVIQWVKPELKIGEHRISNAGD